MHKFPFRPGLRLEYNYMRLNPSAWVETSSTVSETEMEISAQGGIHHMQKLSSAIKTV